MAKFRFRLQTLLRLRETNRDEKRGRLAEAYQAEGILSVQQQEVHRELHQLQQLQRDCLTTSQTNINQLIEIQRHQLTLHGQQNTMHKQTEILASEVERRRQDLVESDRQVRVLEKLQQRQREKQSQNMQREEAKAYDDIGQWRCDAWNGQDRQPVGEGEP